MATKNTGPVSARQRARAAKAKLDADRKARDKRVEEQATEWYQLEDTIAQAQAAVEEARAQQASVVVALGEENVSVDDAAELLGIEPGEVRALRKQHRNATSGQAPATLPAGGNVPADEAEPAEQVAS